MSRDDLRDLGEAGSGSGAGLAMHQRDVRERRILREPAIDVLRANLRAFCIVERAEPAAITLQIFAMRWQYAPFTGTST